MRKSKHHKDCLVHTQTFLGRGLYLGFDKHHACPCKDLNAAKKSLKRLQPTTGPEMLDDACDRLVAALKEEQHTGSYIHLTQGVVRDLIQMLEHFAEHGVLPEVDE